MLSTTNHRTLRAGSEHFEPSETNDPKTQRQLHAKLEQIDYTAYAANRKEITQSLAHLAGTCIALQVVTAPQTPWNN